MRFIGKGRPWTGDEVDARLQRFMTRYQESGKSLLVAVRKADDTPVGHAGLVQQDIDGQPELEVGYWIARPFWGQGYATEAATFWRDYAWRTLLERRLIALIQFGNYGSMKVADKIGMEFERSVTFLGQDVALWAVTGLGAPLL